MFRFAFLISSLWAFSAHADLYRWVDPETGSVKFSSYPPPWYGNEALQRRAPAVEHIPARALSATTPLEPGQDTAKPAAQNLDELERQRRTAVDQINASIGRPGAETQKQLESLAAVIEQLDKVNPEGAPARRAETEALLQKLLKGNQR